MSASGFVAMLFSHPGRARTLREMSRRLAHATGQLSSLGIAALKPPALASSNEHRPWALCRAIFFLLLARGQALAQGCRKPRVKTDLLSQDALVPW